MTNTQELEHRRDCLLGALKHCTNEETENIQEELIGVEDALNACPSCGSSEIDEHDDLACGDEYHDEEREEYNNPNN